MTTGRMQRYIVGMAIAITLAIPGVAAAEDYVNQEQPKVLGEGQARTDAEPAPAAASAGDTRGGSLPITGGDVAGLTAIGVAAVGVGTALVRRSRRATA